MVSERLDAQDQGRGRTPLLLQVRNWQLLIATLLLTGVYVLRHTGALLETGVNIGGELFLAAIMFLAMSAWGVSRSIRMFHVPVAILAVALATAGVIASDDAVTRAGNLVGAYMLVVTIVLLLRLTLSRRRVTGDTLFGALAIYLSIGMLFGIVFTAIASSNPDAFDPAQLIVDGKTELHYFSLVTLTNLGYGDISPVSDGVQILATLEAIMGAVLLVALVGRVVSLMAVQERDAMATDAGAARDQRA